MKNPITEQKKGKLSLSGPGLCWKCS